MALGSWVPRLGQLQMLGEKALTTQHPGVTLNSGLPGLQSKTQEPAGCPRSKRTVQVASGWVGLFWVSR